jgi:phosphatidylserine/phosphatidylglycerophosphate/cardiolipin synthase-like enzyme
VRQPSSLPALIPGNLVEPLTEASETYAVLEAEIRRARRSVHMAYWTVDPTMPLVERKAGNPRLTWDDLLADALRRGVSVRMILSDFDPIAVTDMHEAAWTSYRDFMTIRDRLPETQRGRLALQCVLHEAALGGLASLAAQPMARKLLRAGAVAELQALVDDGRRAEALERFGNMPGLWGQVEIGADRVRVSRPLLPPIRPGSYHEKICVIDGEVAFVGGLDIEQKRYDTPSHDAEDAWHDVACRIEGPAVPTVERHFRERWNRHLPEFRRRTRTARVPEEVRPMPVGEIEPLPVDGAETVGAGAGPVPAVLVRTHSGHRRSPFALGPKAELREIAEAYEDLVAGADRLIYIETQFFRSLAMAEWLADRGRQRPELRAIMVLPLVPERISLGGKPNDATRHGQHLQKQAVARVREALGDRFGVFTLVRNGPAPDRVQPEAQLHGSDAIYVHAKTMVVDDETAIIGSANLNDRSFQTDTESALVWRHPAVVRRFRERLWSELFALDAGDWTGDPLAHWRDTAEANAGRAPGRRQGFVVPLPERYLAMYAKRSRLVPDRLV